MGQLLRDVALDDLGGEFRGQSRTLHAMRAAREKRPFAHTAAYWSGSGRSTNRAPMTPTGEVSSLSATPNESIHALGS